jgi:hypothetical protein
MTRHLRGLRGSLLVGLVLGAAGLSACHGQREMRAPPRHKVTCEQLRASARHELGDTGSEIETHCVRQR